MHWPFFVQIVKMIYFCLCTMHCFFWVRVSIWLIFDAKFVRKCSGRDNFFIDYSYWLFHLRYFIVSAKKLCICNYSKTTPPFNLHDLKFIFPHLGLQFMTFPKQLLIDDFCWMMNFYLLYSRKLCKNFRNSCNRNFQLCQ